MKKTLLRCCLLLFLACVAGFAGADARPATRTEALVLSLEAIEHPAFSARQIVLRLDGLGSLTGGSAGGGTLEIGRLVLAGRAFSRVRLHCAALQWSPQRIACRHGELQPAGAPILPMEFSYAPEQRRLELSFGEGDFATVAALWPELAAWHVAGRFTARLRLDAAHADLHMQLREAAFADTGGQIAGEHIATTLEVALQRRGTRWDWRGQLAWPQGEVYVAPLYRKGGMRLVAAGQYAAESLNVERATLHVDDIGSVEGSLQWQFPGGLHRASLASGPLDLAVLVPQFVQPFVDLHAGNKLTAAGTVRVALALDAQGIERLDVALADGRVEGGPAALHGIEAQIPWRRTTATQASFHAGGGRLAGLPLGAFDLPLAMQGFDFSLPRVEIPLLDGGLMLEDFHAARNAAGWQWTLGGAVYPVSMPLLTQALGWPKMDGVLSAALPQIRYADRVLALDGALVISVFDGYLSATGLKVVDPLGALPRLQADVEARHLDLGMLTHTFSFGDIAGYVDADLKGFETAGKRPLAFDAQIRSSDGDYERRISQRAVQNISSLGGAGAGAAIQRSFLHFFDTFGYEKLGLRCRLVNDICLMGGIPDEDSASGYMLVKGGGIPALSVIGYNRRVYWDELVSRVQAVIAGNSKIEIR